MEKAGHFWQPTAMAIGHSVIWSLLSPLWQVRGGVWCIVRRILRLNHFIHTVLKVPPWT